MSRTNKTGIFKKKQQQAKQKKLMDASGGSTVEQTAIKREYTNPLGQNYMWFFRSGKFFCDQTSGREDPAGYRLVGKPNSTEKDFVLIGAQSWGYRRFLRKFRKQNIK